MENRNPAAQAEARSKYRLQQEALRRAAEVGGEATTSTRGPAPALEATLASISDEVTAEAQERRAREAKLRNQSSN
jgi:hypothetical protein